MPRGAPFPRRSSRPSGDLGQPLRLASLSLPPDAAGRRALNGRRGELPRASSVPPPARSRQSGAAVRGGVSGPGPGPGPGGGVSGAVTAPRDPEGDVRGAARAVGARLARARGGGAGAPAGDAAAPGRG